MKWLIFYINRQPPDLTMIVPLARLFEVTVDELFGMNQVDKNQEELCRAFEETWHTGDTAKRYEISKKAVKEYPGNFEYLLWLADAEAEFAIHNCERYSKEQNEHFQSAVKYYEMIIEDCSDIETKNAAIYGIVMNLPNIGRREEAVSYAKQHPQADELLMWCLVGEEREACRQQLIYNCMMQLVRWLEWGHHDLIGIQKAESIIKIMIEDGNFLYNHDTLMHNYIWQAMCLVREERMDEAIASLKESYQHAKAYMQTVAQAKKEPLFFTCTTLNKLKFDEKELFVSGTSTLAEDFKEYLTWKEFDVLRNRDDFRQLMLL